MRKRLQLGMIGHNLALKRLAIAGNLKGVDSTLRGSFLKMCFIVNNISNAYSRLSNVQSSTWYKNCTIKARLHHVQKHYIVHCQFDFRLSKFHLAIKQRQTRGIACL